MRWFMITPLIVLFFSHLCNNFFLQNGWLVEMKHDQDPKRRQLALLGHSLVFLILALPLSWLLVDGFSTFYIIGLVIITITPVSYTHLRAHETDSYLVCRLLLEKKKI